MNEGAVFKRYEIKYLISVAQKQEILAEMLPYMRLDRYGKTTIRNLYLDTDNFRLIRRSLEKPHYKEKLRLRSYEQASADKPIFVELKKKYDGVVYKRRLKLPEQEVMHAFENNLPLPINSQIGKEIEYCRNYYSNLTAKVFLSYEREAYYCLDGSDFRITFDDNILYRREDLSLCIPPYGTRILDGGYILMEIKTSGAIPLWLTGVLTKLKVYKTSFSKYGAAYMDIVKKGIKGEIEYANVI